MDELAGECFYGLYQVCKPACQCQVWHNSGIIMLHVMLIFKVWLAAAYQLDSNSILVLAFIIGET